MRGKPVDPADRCIWKIEQWPALDHDLWARNTAPRDPFQQGDYRGTRTPASLAMFARGYGRWLSFLAGQRVLNPEQAPLDRATPDRLHAWLLEMQSRGCRAHTITMAFVNLARALAILAPGADLRWITHPRGQSLRVLLQPYARERPVPDAGVLLAWARGMMDQAGNLATTPACIAYRNGLILALFAARARRLRAMQGLRIGHELSFDGTRYRIDLPADLVKTRRPDSFLLPSDLTPYLDTYLQVVRPALLGSQTHEALWVTQTGTKLTAKAIQEMVRIQTTRRFGFGFGPHRFRHAIATTIALRDPGHVGTIAGVLGISHQVAEQHYNLARQTQAAERYAAILQAERERRPGPR